MTGHDLPDVPVCYRHPDRPTRVRCTRCGRPICPDCMVPGPVGYLCPDDAQQPARVQRVAARVGGPPRVTVALLVVIAAMYAGQQLLAGFTNRYLLVPAAVAIGEWWRLVTSAFLHGSLIHIGFNGYLLYLLGRMLEPVLGARAFASLFLAGLAGGALGVVLLSGPFTATLGASGAVFGLMGVAMVGLRRRGIDPWRSDIGSLVILNLVLTFLIPGISIGGHLGGFAGGAAGAAILLAARDRRHPALGAALAAVLGLVLLAAAFVAADIRTPG